MLAGVLACWPAVPQADDLALNADLIRSNSGYRSEASDAPLAIDAGAAGSPWVLEENRFQLDGHTQVRGWRLSEHWYFGYQRGDAKGLSLVWQQQRTRISLTPAGMRVSRLLF